MSIKYGDLLNAYMCYICGKDSDYMIHEEGIPEEAVNMLYQMVVNQKEENSNIIDQDKYINVND